MIKFESYPDEIFSSILSNVLDYVIDEYNDDVKFSNNGLFYFNEKENKMFGEPKIFLNEFKRLKQAHESEDLFFITDYHFLIIDRLLRYWRDLYNDGLFDRYTCLGREIKELDLEMMLMIFFYDNDYEMSPEVARALKEDKAATVASDTFPSAIRASMGEVVDLQDLHIDKITDPEEIEEWKETKLTEEDLLSLWFNDESDECDGCGECDRAQIEANTIFNLKEKVFGFKNSPKGIIPEPDEVVWVTFIFESYANGTDEKRITETLVQKKAPLPPEKEWTKEVVLKILDNLNYKGQFREDQIIEISD